MITLRVYLFSSVLLFLLKMLTRSHVPRVCKGVIRALQQPDELMDLHLFLASPDHAGVRKFLEGCNASQPGRAIDAHCERMSKKRSRTAP